MSQRILVVEDDLDNLRITTTVLSREGYEVVSARDAVTALAAIAAVPPALVVLDLDLPGVSGFEAAQRIRLREESRDLPILALTALANRADAVRAREAGCDDVLTKPCRPEALRERVRRWLAA
ncbi:MAG: response regulator [Candidatus Binatia bacterium]